MGNAGKFCILRACYSDEAVGQANELIKVAHENWRDMHISQRTTVPLKRCKEKYTVQRLS